MGGISATADGDTAGFHDFHAWDFSRSKLSEKSWKIREQAISEATCSGKHHSFWIIIFLELP